jgi:hypothetical protein
MILVNLKWNSSHRPDAREVPWITALQEEYGLASDVALSVFSRQIAGRGMTSWTDQLQSAQHQVAEIKGKISLQQQAVERLNTQGSDTGLQLRLIAIMEQSLARTTTYVQFIEQRILVHQDDTQRRRPLLGEEQSLTRGQSASADLLAEAVLAIRFQQTGRAKEDPAELSAPPAFIEVSGAAQPGYPCANHERPGLTLVAAAIAMAGKTFQPGIATANEQPLLGRRHSKS